MPKAKLTQCQAEVEIVVQGGALVANAIIVLQLFAQLTLKINHIGGNLQVDDHIALVLVVRGPRQERRIVIR